jgi:hypothetical protein
MAALRAAPPADYSRASARARASGDFATRPPNAAGPVHALCCLPLRVTATLPGTITLLTEHCRAAETRDLAAQTAIGPTAHATQVWRRLLHVAARPPPRLPG